MAGISSSTLACVSEELANVPEELKINHCAHFYSRELDIRENCWSQYMGVSKCDNDGIHKLRHQISLKDRTLPWRGDEFKAVCLFLRQVIEYNALNPQSLLLREKVFLKINGEKVNEVIKKRNGSLSWLGRSCLRASIERLPVEKLRLPVEKLAVVADLWKTDMTLMGRFLYQYGKDLIGHSITPAEMALKEGGHIRSTEEQLRRQLVNPQEGFQKRASSDFNLDHIEKAIAPVKLSVIELWESLLETIKADSIECSKERSSNMLALEGIAKTKGISRFHLIRYCDFTCGRVDAKLASIWKEWLELPARVDIDKYNASLLKQQLFVRLDIDKCKASLSNLRAWIFELSNQENECRNIKSKLTNGLANCLDPSDEIIGVLKGNLGKNYNLPYWQNDGKDYSIDLKAKDVLIVGARAVLEEYEKSYSNIVYKEDLTPQQKDYLYSRRS